ncbi:hypothetical protein [Stieleria mannarensis]|uniref:hypothetical protein n=1 Tax=Stieleria mannarensis TaxID=2755585 RepID=UPI0016009C9E|nr:hypothetical protein [Rhodopirellula sp. JC639]
MATAVAPRPRPRRGRSSRLTRFFRGFSVEKSFTVLSLLVASGLITICLLDILLAWPWKHASLLFDWTNLLAGFVMLGLTYDVFRDQSR